MEKLRGESLKTRLQGFKVIVLGSSRDQDPADFVLSAIVCSTH